MRILHAKGSRGASVLAAVAFVAMFGLVTMIVINIPSTPDRRALTAQAGTTGLSDAPTAQQPAETKEEQISSECKNGEVHTVREELTANGPTMQPTINEIGTGTSGTGKPTEKISKCYVPDLAACKTADPSKCLIMKKNEPTFTSDPVCKPLADIGKCIVQYCPIDMKGNTCIVIKCEQGDTACLKKAMGSTEKAGVQATAELLKQGGKVYDPSTGKSDLTFDTKYSSQEYRDAVATQGNIIENNTSIAKIDQQLNDCVVSGCANAAELNKQRLSLVDKNIELQQKLDVQMQALSKNQGSLADITGSVDPVTGLPTSKYGSPTKTGNIDPITGLPTDTYRPKTSTGFSGPCPGGQAVNPVTGMCAGGTPPPGTGGAPVGQPGSGGFGSSLFGGSPANRAATNGLFYQLGNMVGNLIKGNGIGGASQQQQFSCAKTQDEYQQQQQQYNQQIQQYNQQLQQQQYQQQQMQMQQYGGGYGGGGLTPVYGYDQYGSYGIIGYQQSQAYGAPSPYGSAYGSPYGYGNQYTGGNSMMGTYGGYGQPQPPRQPPQPCYNNQQPQHCSFSPQQPSSASCTSGTWKPTTSGNGCIGGWQCVPNGSTGGTGGTNAPAGTISCEPKMADVGMTIAISYSCANSTQSSGGGFNTNGALSGSATTTIQNPPQGTNIVTYTLTCKSGAATAGAQCSVQFGKPGIVFLAEPSVVKAGGTTTLGWITSGMQSCLVSSPDLPSFSAQNADNRSPNGIAVAGTLLANTRFALNCVTVGGVAASASTTVTITQ